jgi:hypothetical protein
MNSGPGLPLKNFNAKTQRHEDARQTPPISLLKSTFFRSSRRESALTSPPEIMSGLTSAATSINQYQHSSILGGFDHILKLPVSRDWFLEFGGR